MKTILFSLIILLLHACTNSRPPAKHVNQLKINNSGFSFKLNQRATTEIPSDSNTVFCEIDDITKGQTMLRLTEKGKIFLIKSVREQTTTDFEFNGKYFKLICDRLINKGLREDYGYFTIVRDSTNYLETKDESDKIELLIKKVEVADIVFIRNGEEHSGKEAAKHLRKKWDYSEGQVKTVDSFIENLASKSSVSGKPYEVRLKNGKVMQADKWFYSLLKTDI